MFARLLSVLAALGSAAETGQVPALRLVKTVFSQGRDISVDHRLAMIDTQFVDLVMHKCSMHDFDAGSPLALGRAALVHVEQSEFKGITAPSVLVTEGCQKLSDDFTVPEGTSTTNYWITAGSLTCENVVFQDVTSACRGSDEPKCGGAIWAPAGVTKVTLLWTKFIRCGTVDGTSSDLGGAVLCAADDFVFDYCEVEDCSNAKSITLFRKTASDSAFGKRVITGCNFTKTRIQAANEIEPTAGGSGFVITNTNDLTLVNCHFNDCEKTSSTTVDGGCYRFASTTGAVTLNLTDCTFINTRAPRGGCFAMVGVTPTIYISGCTFQQTMAAGDRRTGGVFFLDNIPTELIVNDCVFDRCEANDGAIMYKYSTSAEVLTVPNFEMTNTVINQCTNRKGSGGKVLAVVIPEGGTCVFNNNTLSNLAKDAFSISGWKSDQLELTGCRFDTLVTSYFVLGLSGFTGTLLILKNCQFSNVQTDNAINNIDGTNFFTTVTLEECTVESVTRTSNSWIEITDGALTVKDCIFQNSDLSSFFLFGGTTVTMEGTEFREITTVPQLCTVSQGTITMTDVKVLGGSSVFGTLTCTSATIKQLTADKSTATAEWLVLQAGAFTLSDCCFQGGSGKYIKVESGVTLTFESPMCFDKTQDESLTLPEGFEKTWTDDIFGCEVCESVATTTESLDPSDDPEPGDSSEGQTDPETDDPETDDPGTGGSGNQDKGNGLTAGETAAIVVVVLLVVAVAVILTVIFLLRRKKKDDSHDDDAEVFDDDTSIATAETVELGGSSHIEEASRSNPIFSVVQEAEDFSSVFEEANSS